jgi:phosphatidylglycerol lysyltransferase
MANLRHTVTRARRTGVTVEAGYWERLSDGARDGVEQLDREWRRAHPLRMSFSLSSLDDAKGDRRLFAIAWKDGRVEAAVSWLEGFAGGGRVLDLIRRRRDAEPGSIELLLRDCIAGFAAEGVEWASLGMAGSAGLRRYKQKFRPEWHDRYLVFPLLAAPMALLAVAWVHLVRERSKRGA